MGILFRTFTVFPYLYYSFPVISSLAYLGSPLECDSAWAFYKFAFFFSSSHENHISSVFIKSFRCSHFLNYIIITCDSAWAYCSAFSQVLFRFGCFLPFCHLLLSRTFTVHCSSNSSLIFICQQLRLSRVPFFIQIYSHCNHAY